MGISNALRRDPNDDIQYLNKVTSLKAKICQVENML